ncbi:MAG: hypothetical protein II808_00585 [Clostridia bacterium]|nr:hypothetical protein [Clostridia bacterium]
MLGKLMKYEFKATYRIFLPFFAGILVMAGFAKIFFLVNDHFDNIVTNVFSGLITALYVFAVGAVAILPAIISFYRFYKNLVTDEGYLSFTLPVTPMQHIMCKFLTSMVWCLTGFAVTFLSIAILLAGDDTLPMIIRSVFINLQFIAQSGDVSLWFIVIEIICVIINSFLSAFAVYYLCIAIGQMLFKNKLLGSFAVFGIYYVATQLLGTVITVPLFFVAESAAGADASEIIMHVIFTVYALYYLALFLVGIFVTNHIFKKKLNLA